MPTVVLVRTTGESRHPPVPCLSRGHLGALGRSPLGASAFYYPSDNSSLPTPQAKAAIPPCHASRGAVWSHLGALRWALLMPTHPVDPACKHALKAEMARDRTREAEVEHLSAALAQARPEIL